MGGCLTYLQHSTLCSIPPGARRNSRASCVLSLSLSSCSVHPQVVTTYATLGADYGGKKNGGSKPNFPPLGAIEWHRLVLDEAHT